MLRLVSKRPSPVSRVAAGMPKRCFSQGPVLPNYDSPDHNIDHYRKPVGNETAKKVFHYSVVGSARFLYASMARVTVVKIVSSLAPSADVLAMGSLEVDLSQVAEGTSVTVKWRGKPVFIRHRTPAEIDLARKQDTEEMRDPQKDADRAQNEKFLVLIGICTHLGCVPVNNAGDYGGWYCPCHGSHYDISGRIRKGPAPLNMEVPQYKFVNDTTILIG